MTPVTFANIKTVIQFISVFISIFINALSIYLIVTKSPKIMGTYRHLMIYFCGCSMVFSVLDVIVQPVISIFLLYTFAKISQKEMVFLPK